MNQLNKDFDSGLHYGFKVVFPWKIGWRNWFYSNTHCMTETTSGKSVSAYEKALLGFCVGLYFVY